MRSSRFAPPLVVALVLAFVPASAEELRGLGIHDLGIPDDAIEDQTAESTSGGRLYLHRAIGDLSITLPASTDTFTAYFHIPIPYGDQAPVWIDVQSPRLIDYRFIPMDPPNMLVAARFERSPGSFPFRWEAWVLIKEETYADVPWQILIPERDEIPDEVAEWLEPSDCVQSTDPFVQGEAAEVRDGYTLLQGLAVSIADYCTHIGYGFDHRPIAFDAYYAMNWGSSCTGRAHAGAALFRANGVPARSLHVMPIWYPLYFDMHWIIEYWVPTYGWVRLETTLGQIRVPPHTEIVTLVCGLEDEFPLFYPSAIEGYWHTSDPALGMYNPNWGRSHVAFPVSQIPGSEEDVELALQLTQAAAVRSAQFRGLTFDAKSQPYYDNAGAAHLQAFDDIQAGDLAAYIESMSEAVQSYDMVRTGPMETIYFDDFEAPETDWVHGGAADEWELGTPTVGPPAAYSGTHCWGTDLDDTYENNADSWLLSPPFDLTEQSAAFLGFRVFNQVQDRNQGWVHDPLWVDITTDGKHFEPLCSHMGGVNDDPEVPSYGGWTRMVLDLTPYLGEPRVQVRFRFRSDGSVVQPGSYIDDVQVFGRTPVFHRPRLTHAPPPPDFVDPAGL